MIIWTISYVGLFTYRLACRVFIGRVYCLITMSAAVSDAMDETNNDGASHTRNLKRLLTLEKRNGRVVKRTLDLVQSLRSLIER